VITAVRKLTIKTPGSTANLGPGFDALALALSVHCTLRFEMLEKDDPSIPLITLKSELLDELPTDETNMIYQVISSTWRADKELLKRVRITIESDIPPGKGLGSSAAAAIGAVCASYAIADEQYDHDSMLADGKAMLADAMKLEGHVDNISASLLGGLVACSYTADGRSVITQKLMWPTDWAPIVVVPPYVLSTKKSRSVLPQTVSREDAVNNVQKVSLLLAAVTNKDEDAMREALHDRLHEPYRLELVPELGEVRKLLADLPILGCVLSGAGSSVLVLANRRHRREILQSLKNWAATKKEPPQVLDLQVDQEGLRIQYE
jgi:homoserine kinase